MKKLAEAEGTKQIKLAEAEGQKALWFAEAEAFQKKEMAPALALEKMVQSFGGNPDLLVQYKMVDQYKGMAEAEAKMFEHIHLDNVAVYGDTNTAAQFMTTLSKNIAPSLQILKEGIGDQFKKVFGEINKKGELPNSEKKDENNFDEVK